MPKNKATDAIDVFTAEWERERPDLDFEYLATVGRIVRIAAYLREPEFLPARPRLYAAAEADPALAERILPAMLERTPDEPRVHRAWLAHLARVGDQTRLQAAMQAAEPVLRER